MEHSVSYDLQKGQFDVVEVMVTNQFKAFSINWMLNMWAEWLILIWPYNLENCKKYMYGY